jgi:hypothetical protein
MTKNLDTADRITKLTLSGMIIFSYFADIINGPLALFLVILSVTVLVVNLIRLGLRHDN